VDAHTKCSTPLQKRVRKALRACIRATRTLNSIDVTKVDADIALSIEASINAIERLKKAFAQARTDADLLSAMYSAMILLDSLDEAHGSQSCALNEDLTTMLDTTPVTIAITRLISTGTTEQALIAAVTHLFPNLSPAELSQALQVAQTEAERRAPQPH